MMKFDFESIDWQRFTDPPEYSSDEVVPAFESITVAENADQAATAYHRMLNAIGHDHSGTLYPAAEQAIGPLLNISITGDKWPSVAALNCLIDLLGSFERFDHPAESGTVSEMKKRMFANARLQMPAITARAGALPESDLRSGLVAELLGLLGE